MINIRFSLENPWWDRFDNIWCGHGKTPFKHKFWEIQVMKSDDIVAIDLRISTRTDHAGLDLWIGFLGYAINLNFYDHRHWNAEKNQWEIY
jgi:hypothetical protein